MGDQKNNQPQLAHESFFASLIETLTSILGDKGILAMLVIAPIMYGFFYPWPYSNEIVQKVPVAIVDEDSSRLSQLIIQASSASPYLDVRQVSDESQAKQAIWDNQIAGYMVIPQNLQKRVYASKPVRVSVLGNGGYLLLNKNIQLGFAQAVGTVSAGIEIKKQLAKGDFIYHAKRASQAISLDITPMYNSKEGYGAYVVPGVSILILQQTMLMATAMLIGTWFEVRRQHANLRGWLGRIAGVSFLGFMVGCFYYGWVFSVQDYSRGHNLWGSLCFLALYCPTVVTMGAFLGMWFRQRERSMQLMIFSSLPLFFLSGYSWPNELLPMPLQYVRLIFPSTYGMHASVRMDQMGASVAQVMPYLLGLLALWIFYFSLLMGMEYRHRRQHSQQ